ncbi:hypothetical protein [Micromonospora peucetia]|uniref:Uncharacterized protein n=1 Tax=Micromonospora peucetia TaxID=47871 RepID=A0ABZ1ENU6_9ACTN|nr:hypothetical protein [Micromonospora peucetia]WSA35895.1 hypothetical protein OIE14_24295 [Micromonospora peucetia]
MAAAPTELIAVAVAFEYLNRMVNIFLVESPIPDTMPAFLRGAGVAVALCGRHDRRGRGGHV